jgi:hypothetical protein
MKKDTMAKRRHIELIFENSNSTERKLAPVALA